MNRWESWLWKALWQWPMPVDHAVVNNTLGFDNNDEANALEVVDAGNKTAAAEVPLVRFPTRRLLRLLGDDHHDHHFLDHSSRLANWVRYNQVHRPYHHHSHHHLLREDHHHPRRRCHYNPTAEAWSIDTIVVVARLVGKEFVVTTKLSTNAC